MLVLPYDFILFTWALLALFSSANARPPHVLVVLMDDVGHSDISYGGAEYSTPNIDSLAATGVSLTNFYTTPTCSPSRAAFQTGRYAFGTGLQVSPMGIKFYINIYNVYV